MADFTGGINASIPLQAGQGVTQPINPLSTYSQYQQLQSGRNQLQQQQNELSMFPGQQALQQQAVSGGALALSKAQNQAAYAMLSPYLSDPNMTHDKLTTALAGIEASGVPTGGIIADFQKSLPGGDGPGFNQSLRSLVGSRMLTDPGAQLAANVGTPGTMANGQQIQPGMIGGILTPGAGAFTPSGQATQVYPTRSELLTQQPGVDPATGQPTATPLATRAGQQGQSGLTGPAGAPSGPAAPSPLAGTFATRGAPTGGTAGAPQAAVPAPVSPSASVPTGAVPGQNESSALAAQHAASAFDRARTFQSDMFPLTQAQQALANAPTGKGSDVLQGLQSVMNTMTPSVIKRFSPVDPNEVAAYDEANKYLTQVQASQPGAGRSDQGLSTAGAASPSVHISNQAAQVVLRGMIGLRRMEQDGTLAFSAATDANGNPLPSQAYDRFMANFATKADPRVYSFDQMSPQQQGQMLSSMPVAKQNQFLMQLNGAETRGVISAPGGAANGQ